LGAPQRVEAEFARLQDVARKLMRKPWARRRIRLLSSAPLTYGTLTREEILRLAQ
jgi:hypothetical protein